MLESTGALSNQTAEYRIIIALSKVRIRIIMEIMVIALQASGKDFRRKRSF